MATHQQTHSEELEERVEELEQRVSTLEGLFSERLLDREQAHTETQTNNDAREQFDTGEERRVVVDSPPDEGRDPTKAVGRIDGVVTFIEPKEFDVDENDVLRVRIKDKGKNTLKANPLEKIRE